jgi:hypothetical protein
MGLSKLKEGIFIPQVRRSSDDSLGRISSEVDDCDHPGQGCLGDKAKSVSGRCSVHADSGRPHRPLQRPELSAGDHQARCRIAIPTLDRRPVEHFESLRYAEAGNVFVLYVDVDAVASRVITYN